MENSIAESLSPGEGLNMDSQESATVSTSSSVLEEQASSATFKNPAQPYTALKDSLKNGVGNDPKKIRFFGPRFMAIWVMPMAVTGIIMEFLFVGPARNVNPFN